LPLPPCVYGTMLAERLRKHGSRVVLLNTGLNGTGSRYDLAFTRRILECAASGQLDEVECSVDPVFGFRVPKSCPGVENSALLDSEHYFSEPDKFLARRLDLARQFHANAEKLGEHMPPDALAAGPKVE